MKTTLFTQDGPDVALPAVTDEEMKEYMASRIGVYGLMPIAEEARAEERATEEERELLERVHGPAREEGGWRTK